MTKELRTDEPTTKLRWKDGVLQQEWYQLWAKWEDDYPKWQYEHVHVWKDVPFVVTPS